MFRGGPTIHGDQQSRTPFRRTRSSTRNAAFHAGPATNAGQAQPTPIKKVAEKGCKLQPADRERFFIIILLNLPCFFTRKAGTPRQKKIPCGEQQQKLPRGSLPSNGQVWNQEGRDASRFSRNPRKRLPVSIFLGTVDKILASLFNEPPYKASSRVDRVTPVACGRTRFPRSRPPKAQPARSLRKVGRSTHQKAGRFSSGA